MGDNGKAATGGNFCLTALDFRIEKFFYLAALQADQMVVMLTVIQLEHRLAAFKMMTTENTGLLKLGEYAVNRRYSNIAPLAVQESMHIFGGHVLCARLVSLTTKQVKDYAARRCGLETTILDVLIGGAHWQERRAWAEEGGENRRARGQGSLYGTTNTA